MLLKCIDVTEWRDKDGNVLPECPFKLGDVYDVAEIYERPIHVMARLPGEKRWPRPGEPMFGYDFEDLFEPTNEPLEIISCGYIPIELDDFFGVHIDNPADVKLLRALEELWVPDDGEPFETWCKRRAGNVAASNHLRIWYDHIEGPGGIYVTVHDKIVYCDKDLVWPWVSVGADVACPTCLDALRDEINKEIADLLGPLGIAHGPAVKDFRWYWYGDGPPRLIGSNAPGSAPWLPGR